MTIPTAHGEKQHAVARLRARPRRPENARVPALSEVVAADASAKRVVPGASLDPPDGRPLRMYT